MSGPQQTSMANFIADSSGKRKGDDQLENSEKKKKKKSSFNRKYDTSYIKYGFTTTGDSVAPNPLCVICGEKLCNEAMKPSKLQRHLTTKHPTLKDKTEEFFERKKRELDAQRQVLISSTSVNVAATKASYLVAHRIAKAKKNFTIGEELILPAAKDICRELLGEKAVSKLEHVPLSDNTVARRIDDMAEDIEGQLLGRLKASPWYAIQVDESTDVENKAIMLVYVRYVHQDEVQEDLLCCLSLPSTTTGSEIFQVLNEYVAGRLEWKFCVGVCTDGAAAMTGRLSGFTVRVKEVAPECEATHCMIHREMLASKKMSPELHAVLNNAIRVINHIKAHALNTRLFELLCEDMDADHKRLLLHTEVRWLSKGKALTRVFELREELQKFLSNKQSALAAHFSDKSWLAKLAYLSDIFMALNDLNLTMQGRMADTFRLADKIAGFKAKLETWARRVNRGVFDMFSNLSSFSEDAEGLGQLIHCHLTSLSDEFERYFPSEKDPRNGKVWMRNPFQDDDGQNQLSSRQEDQLLELRHDGGLKTVFNSTPLTSFWIKASREYIEISTLALKTLLPFPTSYLCEAGFSAMTATKTRLRNRLDVRNTLRVSLSTIKPRFDVLVAAKQSQGSH